MPESSKKRGFASLDPERLRQIASSGGIARKRAYEAIRLAKRTTLPEPSPRQSSQT